MHFLFSGEGPADCGTGVFSDRICTAEHFEPGPLVFLTGQIIERKDGYAPVDSECCGLLREEALNAAIKKLKRGGRGVSLPGKKIAPETLYFRKAARALARCAKQWAGELQDEVAAVFFRDNDDRRSTPKTVWKHKYDAVMFGFQQESFAQGVPMIPQPTSEAWLICAIKDRPYENCHRLEERSGSPKAKQPLKQELESILGTKPTREVLCELVTSWRIDEAKINMPSFNAFRTRLLEVARSTEGC